MNMMRRGMKHLNTRRHETMTETVTYKRDALSVELDATPMSPQPEESRPSEQHVIDERRVDWIMQADDLQLGGSATTPRTGDEIVFDDGTTTRTYRVGPDGTEDSWRYTSTYGFGIRVHTTRIGEEASP